MSEPLEFMTAPEVCLACDRRITRKDGTWVHVSSTPCLRLVPCIDAERHARWNDWLTTIQWARTVGRGGAVHITRYGTPDLALCGVPVGAPVQPGGSPACKSCRWARDQVSYAWRYERAWDKPYGGSAVQPIVEMLGARPSHAAGGASHA